MTKKLFEITMESGYLDQTIDMFVDIEEVVSHQVTLEHLSRQMVALSDLSTIDLDKASDPIRHVALESLSKQLSVTISQEGIGDQVKVVFNKVIDFIRNLVRSVSEYIKKTFNALMSLLARISGMEKNVDEKKKKSATDPDGHKREADETAKQAAELIAHKKDDIDKEELKNTLSKETAYLTEDEVDALIDYLDKHVSEMVDEDTRFKVEIIDRISRKLNMPYVKANEYLRLLRTGMYMVIEKNGNRSDFEQLGTVYRTCLSRYHSKLIELIDALNKNDYNRAIKVISSESIKDLYESNGKSLFKKTNDDDGYYIGFNRKENGLSLLIYNIRTGFLDRTKPIVPLPEHMLPPFDPKRNIPSSKEMKMVSADIERTISAIQDKIKNDLVKKLNEIKEKIDDKEKPTRLIRLVATRISLFITVFSNLSMAIENTIKSSGVYLYKFQAEISK